MIDSSHCENSKKKRISIWVKIYFQCCGKKMFCVCSGTQRVYSKTSSECLTSIRINKRKHYTTIWSVFAMPNVRERCIFSVDTPSCHSKKKVIQTILKLVNDWVSIVETLQCKCCRKNFCYFSVLSNCDLKLPSDHIYLWK